MNHVTRRDEYRATIVCIDSYEDSILNGRLYNPFLKGGRTFKNLVQFLLCMDSLLESMQFPQSFIKTRAFSPVPESLPNFYADDAIQEGKLATLVVKVLFKQNASWQGSIAWLEQGKEENFRSVLELILLMDSALRSTESDSNL